jgi:hypothetical protein
MNTPPDEKEKGTEQTALDAGFLSLLGLLLRGKVISHKRQRNGGCREDQEGSEQ